MTTQTPTEAADSNTTQTTVSADDMSFAEYERMRRGEVIAESKAPSAPEAKTTEQNPAAESDTAEAEAKEESNEDESKDEDASDEEGDTESKDSEKDRPKKKGGFQRRIDKLNARATAAQAEAEYWKQQALKNAGADKPKATDEPAKAEPKAAEGEPNPDEFETHAEYVKAVVKWDREQADKKRDEDARKSQLQTEQERTIKAHVDRVESFKKQTQDFDDVIADVDDVPLSATVQQLLVTSENGPELMYELAKNRAEYERINKLGPLAAARELGKIEAKIASKATTTEIKTEPKKQTKAPNPIQPVGNGKGTVAKSIDDPNLSFAEYERMRREQMKRRA